MLGSGIFLIGLFGTLGLASRAFAAGSDVGFARAAQVVAALIAVGYFAARIAVIAAPS